MREAERTRVAAAFFRAAYASAFRDHLDRAGESGLRKAYELGRDAVARELSLLELTSTHHDVLLEELDHSSGVENARRVTRAAADFLLEALSAYEMVRRSLRETREAIVLERRHAAMLRQLSTLLGDASLAISSHSSLEEVLQLVAEHARELTGAAWCLVRAGDGDGRPSTIACSGPKPTAALDVTGEAFAAVARSPNPTDVVAVETSAAPEVIAAPFNALGGFPFGVVVIGGRDGRRLTEVDKAVLVHIAQMTAAGLERATRYTR